MPFILNKLDERANTKKDRYRSIIKEYKEYIGLIINEEEAIVSHLNDIYDDLSLGYFIREYLCQRFNAAFDNEQKKYKIEFQGNVYYTGDHNSEEYNITSEDVDIYYILFDYLRTNYNMSADGADSMSFLTKAEIKRLIRLKSACSREKAFVLSFALNMDNESFCELLNKVLGEETYDLRNADEVITYYCHSKDGYKNYYYFKKLKDEYEKRLSEQQGFGMNMSFQSVSMPDFTEMAKDRVLSLNTDEDLYDFLLDSSNDLNMPSFTAYKYFCELYEIAKDYFDFEKLEQAEKALLTFIPRDDVVRVNSVGTRIVEKVFVNVNKENTDLPATITKNLLFRSRINNLLNRKVKVERKDLITLKFFIACYELEEAYDLASNDDKEFKYSDRVFDDFVDDCNATLIACGMSKLYPSNAFDNLIMISFASSSPREVFDDIIYYSFKCVK